MLKFAVITFGCKLNQAESNYLQEQLIRRGFGAVSEKQPADLYLINACAVTAKAEKELRQKINQLKRQHPKSFLAVTGCFLSKNKERVDLRISKDKLVKRVIDLIGDSKRTKVKKFDLQKAKRARAMIKIQDGCDNYCAYCIVPYLRDKPKNRSARFIIREIRDKESAGVKEVVLVGTDLRKYQDSASKIWSLNDLLKNILKETTISRIRISSLWPTAITPEMIALIKKEPRLCRHLHLSIQSANNRILKKMNRNYRSQDIERVIEKLKQIPDLNLTADLIVGFPGEREEYFQQTRRLVQRVGFLKIHVFRYSARPMTVAAKMIEQVPEKGKKERGGRLIQLGEVQAAQVKKRYLSRILPVLFESQDNNLWSGLSQNYLRVFVHSSQDLTNQIINVKLVRLFKDGIYGKIDK